MNVRTEYPAISAAYPSETSPSSKARTARRSRARSGSSPSGRSTVSVLMGAGAQAVQDRTRRGRRLSLGTYTPGGRRPPPYRAAS